MKYLLYFILLSVPFNLPSGEHIHSTHNHELCSGYFPPNQLNIPVIKSLDEEPTGISEDAYHDAIDRVVKVYTPIFKKLGKTLKMVRAWEDGTVNANARIIKKNTWQITMYGGMARHKAASIEGFTSVICHEVGHFIAGPPSRGYFNKKMSAEGQSDYYATTKCLRKLYTHQENIDYLKSKELHPYPKLICDLMFEDNENIDQLANCYRSSQAGYDQAMIYRALRGGNDKYHLVNWDQPVKKAVKSRSVTAHPQPQCRLDTYLRGAACPISHDDDFDLSRKDLNKGSCHRGMLNEEFYEKLDTINSTVITEENIPEHINARPLCWFKPGDGGW